MLHSSLGVLLALALALALALGLGLVILLAPVLFVLVFASSSFLSSSPSSFSSSSFPPLTAPHPNYTFLSYSNPVSTFTIPSCTLLAYLCQTTYSSLTIPNCFTLIAYLCYYLYPTSNTKTCFYY